MAKLQQVDSPLLSDAPSSDSGGSVSVKCGSVLGVLHLDKLNVYLAVKVVKNVFFLTLCGILLRRRVLGARVDLRTGKKSIFHEDSSVPLGILILLLRLLM